MHRAIRVMVAGAALAGSTAAQAQQQPSPACNPAQLQTSGDMTSAQVDQQLEHLPQCQHNAPWLAAAGAALNRLGRYAQAADYLERALLLEPEQPYVQLEYALALAGSADPLSALQLLQNLRGNTQLPEALRQQVQAQITRWSEGAAARGQTSQAYVQARWGHDSNLLGSPNLGSLTLTLPGQTLQLPLDESYLSRPGFYRRVDAGWAMQREAWQFAINTSGRDSPQERSAAMHQIQASAEHTSSQHYAGASALHLQSRAGTRYRVLGLSGGLQWTGEGAQACRARTGMEWQQRTLANSPILSGHYGGLLWQRTCDAGSPPTQRMAMGAWQISLRWGRDQPSTTQRPGSTQEQASARWLALGSGWAPEHQWLLDTEIFHQQDATGYSPLLQNNARRRLLRLALRAEYSLPLPGASAWQLIAGAEWQQQRANLPLFRQKSQGAYLAVRRQW